MIYHKPLWYCNVGMQKCFLIYWCKGCVCDDCFYYKSQKRPKLITKSFRKFSSLSLCLRNTDDLRKMPNFLKQCSIARGCTPLCTEKYFEPLSHWSTFSFLFIFPIKNNVFSWNDIQLLNKISFFAKLHILWNVWENTLVPTAVRKEKEGLAGSWIIDHQYSGTGIPGPAARVYSNHT